MASSLEVKHVPRLSPPTSALLIDAVTRADAKGKVRRQAKLSRIVQDCVACVPHVSFVLSLSLALLQDYTAFRIKVVRKSGAVDYLEHRFSDFVALDAALKLQNLVPEGAVLPAKRWFGLFDPAVVEGRRLKLQVRPRKM